jgi:hypothetical protein
LSSSPAAGTDKELKISRDKSNFFSVYSAEIATPKLRGRLTSFTSLAIAVGILMYVSA